MMLRRLILGVAVCLGLLLFGVTPVSAQTQCGGNFTCCVGGIREACNACSDGGPEKDDFGNCRCGSSDECVNPRTASCDAMNGMCDTNNPPDEQCLMKPVWSQNCWVNTCPAGHGPCGSCINGACRDLRTKNCTQWIAEECNIPPGSPGNPGEPPSDPPACVGVCEAPFCGQENGCGTGVMCSSADAGISPYGPIITWPASSSLNTSQQNSVTLYWESVPNADWYLLYLYPSKNPRADMTTPAMAIADSYYSATPDTLYHFWNAFDHYASTGWATAKTGTAVNGGAWIGVDFGPGRTHDVRYITVDQYTPPETHVCTVQVQYSDNGTNWFDAGGTISICSGGAPITTDVAVPASGEHRYWRVLAREATSTGYSWGVENLEFKGNDVVTIESNVAGYEGVWTQSTQHTFTPTSNGYMALIAAMNNTCSSGGEWTEWGGAAITPTEGTDCDNPGDCPPVTWSISAPLEGRVFQGTAALSGGKCVGTGTPLSTAATDITSGAAAYSSGSFGTGWEASRSNDNNPTTGWASAVSGANVNGTTWLAYDVVTPQPASRFTLRQYEVPNNTVASVQWYGSNDWVNWTNGPSVSVSRDGEKRMYSTGLAGSHRYWVMQATAGTEPGHPWGVYEVELMNGAGAETAGTVNGTNLFPDGSYRVDGSLAGNTLTYTPGGAYSAYSVMCPATGSYTGVAGPGSGYDFYIGEPYIRGNAYVGTSATLVNGKCVGTGSVPVGQTLTDLNGVLGTPGGTSSIGAGGNYALNVGIGLSSNVQLRFDAGTNYTCICPVGCQYTGAVSPGMDYDFYFTNQNITGTVLIDDTPTAGEVNAGGLCIGTGTIPTAPQIANLNNVTTNTGTAVVQANGTYSVNATYGTTTPVTLGFDANTYYGCTCPGGCQFTNQSSPATNRNFYIVPSTVTGTVYNDPNGTATLVGGRCTGPAGAANTAGMQVAGTNGGSYNNTTNVAANGTYSLGIPYSGAGVISATLNLPAGGNLICTCPAGCTYGSVTPLETGVNYFTSVAYGPWFQVIGGPVMAYSNAGTAVRNYIPATCTGSCIPYLITRSGGAATSSYLLTGGGSVDLSANAGVQSNQVAQDGASRIGVVDPDVAQERYEYFYRRFLFPENAVSDFGASASDAQKPTAAPVNTDANAYYHTGDMRVQDAWNVSAAESITIFITGDLRIANQIQVANGGFLAFIVQGDIIIEPTVGSATFSSTVGQVEGVYIANGELQLPSAGAAAGGDLKFVGEGTFVGWSGVTLSRNFSDNGTRALQNNTNPVELFRYRPDFLLNAPDEFRLPQVQWREVAP